MRFGFRLVVWLVALAIVFVMVKKQLSAPSVALPPVAQPVAPDSGKAANVREQSRQVQQQVKQQMESLMQQPRPMPEDAQ